MKTDFLYENKGAYLISAFVFATQIVQLLLFIQASSPFLFIIYIILYRLICVRPCRKPQCQVFLMKKMRGLEKRMSTGMGRCGAFTSYKCRWVFRLD